MDLEAAAAVAAETLQVAVEQALTPMQSTQTLVLLVVDLAGMLFDA